MKFTVLTENLKEAIVLAEKNVGKKMSLPALSSVLFVAEKNKIFVIATNLETGIEIWVGGKVEEEGRVVLPARVVSSFVSLVKNEQITFVSKGDNVEISTPVSKTIIQGYPVSDFPVLPKTNTSKTITLPAGLLCKALSSIMSAAATSDIKPEIASILFSFLKKELTVVATDSFRLAERKLEVLKTNTDEAQFLLPYKGCFDLIRLLEKESGGVDVFLEQGQVTFSTNRFRMISRLTEGIYPDYKKIIPRTFSTEVFINHQILADTLRVAGLFTGKLHDITFQIQPKEKTLSIRTSNNDIGQNESHIEAHIQGDAVKISFNYQYIYQGLEQLEDGDVFWGFTSASGPLLMRKKDDDTFFYIVMPMRA